MNKPECVELCPDCPLRAYLPDGQTDPDKARFLSKVGHRIKPLVETGINHDGTGYLSVDRHNGTPQTEVAILAEGVNIGPAVWVRDATWENGDVQKSFDTCDEPRTLKKGFLGFGKQVDCGAIVDLR